MLYILSLFNALGKNLTSVLLGYHQMAPSLLLDDVFYLPENDYEDNDEIDTQYQHEADNDLNLSYFQRNNRNLIPEYRNLCESKTKRVELSDDEFEYQPPFLYEVYCKKYFKIDVLHKNTVKLNKQICAHPSFHCVQRSKTIFLLRRRWDNSCWEPFTKVIPSGCECMWPVSTLGDISPHY